MRYFRRCVASLPPKFLPRPETRLHTIRGRSAGTLREVCGKIMRKVGGSPGRGNRQNRLASKRRVGGRRPQRARQRGKARPTCPLALIAPQVDTLAVLALPRQTCGLRARWLVPAKDVPQDAMGVLPLLAPPRVSLLVARRQTSPRLLPRGVQELGPADRRLLFAVGDQLPVVARVGLPTVGAAVRHVSAA